MSIVGRCPQCGDDVLHIQPNIYECSFDLRCYFCGFYKNGVKNTGIIYYPEAAPSPKVEEWPK